VDRPGKPELGSRGRVTFAARNASASLVETISSSSICTARRGRLIANRSTASRVGESMNLSTSFSVCRFSDRNWSMRSARGR
jgi:hypothetical protein